MFHATMQLLFLATGLLAVGIMMSTVMRSWARIGAALRGDGSMGPNGIAVRHVPVRQAHRRPLRPTSTSIEWSSMKVA